MTRLYWIPGLLLLLALSVWWCTRHVSSPPLDTPSREGFTDRGLEDVTVDAVRRVEQLLQDIQNDTDHPLKMNELEEYFDMHGIEKK